MTVSLKHTKTSAIPDGGDANLVQPSDWNAEHDLTIATGKLVGRTTAGTGTIEEITVGTGLLLSGGTLTSTDVGGTVTSVAALTLGSTGTDLTSTVANPTTTPTITLNVPTASASNRGVLSSADWTTFNNKGSGTVTSVSGTAPVISSGGATPAISMAAATGSVNGYLTSTDWTTFNSKGSGTVTSVSGTAPVVSSGGATPAISMAAATGSVNGYLTSVDWTTFNNKGSGTVTSVSGTAPVVSSGGATPAISMAAATTSVSGYLTSTDWTTFNNKGSGTVTSVTGTAPVVSSGGATPAISMAAATGAVNGYLTSTDWTTFNGKAVYPGAGIANSTGTAWGTSYTTTGTGTVVALATTPTFTTNITAPLIIGGTAVSSTINIRSTSGVGTSDAILFSTGSQAERMRITTGGLVGIGTSVPTGLFNVTASANDSFLLRGHLTLADGVSLYSVNSLNSAVKGMEFAASLFYFNSGPVGIGTASPTYAFDTENSSTAVDYIAGRFLSAAAATGESRTWLKIEKASTYGGAIGGYISQAVGSGLILGTQAGVATPVERMRITQAGNVGIGTTTPNAPLDVKKSDASTTIGGSLSVVKVNNGSGTLNATSGVEFFHANDTSSNTTRLAGVYGVYTSYNAAGLGGALAFATNTAGDATIDERMRITSAGLVGIGTASPANTLDVVGTARVTSTLTLPGTSSTIAALLTNIAEPATISATAATGTIAYYPSSQSVLYYTSNASANWTTNITFSAGTTMNTAMTTGQTMTVVFMVTNGATAYYNNVVQVDGTAVGVTTKWQGAAPAAGNASSVDIYTYTVMKTGNAAFTVFASQTKFV